MKLELLFSYYANLGEGLDVGQGPYGNRLIVEVHGGEFEGETAGLGAAAQGQQAPHLELHVAQLNKFSCLKNSLRMVCYIKPRFLGEYLRDQRQWRCYAVEINDHANRTI